MRLPERTLRIWRRYFGTVSVDDPRPNAKRARYTYFLPSENELLAIDVGDLVKIVVRSHPPSSEWSAERMWFAITACHDDHLTGTLDNTPFDMPQLTLGKTLSFTRGDVIEILWDDDRQVPPPPKLPRREFWDRCIVDQCVLDDGARVHFLYREESDIGEDSDTYKDSGWRIRGDYRDLSDEELNDRKTEYVALGAVLNHDDSWLALIDSPIGSAFIRDWDRDVFVPEEGQN